MRHPSPQICRAQFQFIYSWDYNALKLPFKEAEAYGPMACLVQKQPDLLTKGAR